MVQHAPGELDRHMPDTRRCRPSSDPGRVGFAKRYDIKTAIAAADLLNDRVLPFYDEHGIPLCRVLTDRGSEYCGNPERHQYKLYLAIEDIDHSRIKTKSPQANRICERFHKTVTHQGRWCYGKTPMHRRAK